MEGHTTGILQYITVTCYWSLYYSEVETLEKELPDVRKKLKQAELDLSKAEEGERKAMEEVQFV